MGGGVLELNPTPLRQNFGAAHVQRTSNKNDYDDEILY